MRAYKYLDAEGCAPITGVRWQPGSWVEAAAAVACHEGVHGCLVEDLSRWLDDSLWEIELDGEIVAAPHKVVGARGRLVRRIDGYREAVRALAEDGAWRSRDRAVRVLQAAGDVAAADELAAAATLETLAAFGATVDDVSFEGRAVALAADAAHFALNGLPAQSPFVAACSAGHAVDPGGDQGAFDAGYEAERVHQSAWLATRLGLG